VEISSRAEQRAWKRIESLMRISSPN